MGLFFWARSRSRNIFLGPNGFQSGEVLDFNHVQDSFTGLYQSLRPFVELCSKFHAILCNFMQKWVLLGPH
jgi:hypothetical protein